jgi:DNA-binding Lrp family transcriptional regulator
VDLKDKKILYELSKDSRQPISQIAKKVDLSKAAVIYRMNNMEKEKIIQKYITVVNLRKFNYRTHIIMLEFKKFDIETEKYALNFLKEFPYSIWVASSSGRWDILIDIISRDVEQFDEILTTLLNGLGANIKNYEVLENIKEFYYNHKYLTKGSITESNKKLVSYTPDKIDYRILKEISQNSRKSSTKIADKLKISHDTISYRIKKLKKSGYIEQFTILIDFSKLDLSFYYLFLQFGNMNKQAENQIVTFLKSCSEVLFLAKDIGKYNFNVDIIVENPTQIRNFLIKIRELFGDIMESKETLLIFEQVKNDYFPGGVIKDLSQIK